MKYPLYDELLKQVNEKEDYNIDAMIVCQTINNISLNNSDAVDHYEEIGALIMHYECLTNSNILLTLTPFDGKVLPGNKGILNTLVKFPVTLRRIIYQYLQHYC